MAFGPSGITKLVTILQFFILVLMESCLQYVAINNYYNTKVLALVYILTVSIYSLLNEGIQR